MITNTLDSMALGGMYDLIDGGFCRYSTDEAWLVPHFEKMTYDNALLCALYAEAGRVYKEEKYLEIARESADFMINFMMEAVSPEKRIRCLSYFNLMNSAAVFMGASFGGLLFHHLPPLFGYSFLTLFLISCVGRFLVMSLIADKVQEVRQI